MNHTMVVFNLIYLGLCVVGLGIFGVIFASTRKGARDKPMSVSKWKRRENVWFAVVVAALAIAVAATITDTPWNASAAPNRQQVRVVGAQFGFTITPVDGQPLRVGRQVEFLLHSRDVNHAFAVFDPTGAIVGQAQMMPGWDSSLRLTFSKPGTYLVRCYEYCGYDHHNMLATFKVQG